jgi:lipid-A-disaccharide synthase
MSEPLTVAIVAGEESGDLLGADLVRALQRRTGKPVRLVGVGGRHLAELGLDSFFDAGDIALMGIAAVIRDLPRLARRIRQTACAVVDARPDCLITIDSPEFSLRVARKVRAANPKIPIVHYVCPSVWAWRSSRAAAMRPHVDHILCLLPFEPAALERLKGPPGTFVGHRLLDDPGLKAAAAAQQEPRRLSADREKTLLILPGSRRGEVKALTELFGNVVKLLAARGHRLRLLLPTVPHVAALVAESVSAWPVRPEILVGPEAKWRALGEADAALAASGTVTLELALAGVPLVSCYRFDWIGGLVAPHVIRSWSGSLPNLIADQLIVPEIYPPMLRSEVIAREVEPLLTDTGKRTWQREGFDRIRALMRSERPAGEIAAEVVERVVNGE